MTVLILHEILWESLRLFAYKVKLFQAFEPDDRPSFAANMLRKIEDNVEFFNCIMVSDEVCFDPFLIYLLFNMSMCHTFYRHPVLFT